MSSPVQRWSSRRLLAMRAIVLCATVATVAAACGGGGSSTSSSKKEVILGTTDKVVALDPAGAYDLGSWTIIYNVYQNLLKIPAGGNKPVPDAATCTSSNPTTYVCTLKSGTKFSNGDPLTAEDVAFSFNRVLKIADPNGPSSLFSSLKSATATNPTTVTFTLNTPDATWPYVLTTGAGAIVDHKLFPPDKLLPDSQIIGSGPYVLSKYTSGQQAVFTVNKTYNGDDQIKNGGFIVQYFQQPSALKLAIEQGTVDVAYRNLSPTDIKSLQGESSKGVQVVTGNGTEIRYLVFNLKTQPGTSDAQKLAIRQAVAYTINRQDIANNVYNGTVEPLYSIVPAGLLGHTEAFKDSYGAAPDPAKAKSVLAAAGITTPVPLTIWWTPTHYGAVSADEYTEIQRQLNASGLFKVSLQSAEWQSYSKAYATDQYATYQLGWFPDFPDADDYTSPFYLCNKEFMNNHYCNQQVDKLIAQEKASTDQATRDAAFAQIQKLTATDAPLIPVWQGKQVGVIRSNVSGVQDTFDPSFTFRFWLISK